MVSFILYCYDLYRRFLKFSSRNIRRELSRRVRPIGVETGCKLFPYLDEEADMFVVKLWRLLIYETEAREEGINQ